MRQIAVLPLTNLSQDPANDYFADGLTGEIIRNLPIIDVLAVRSQTSSFFFKGKPQNVREAGKQLDAEYILAGSVLRSGQQLRIKAQLVRVRDDFPLWSGRYDRGLIDIFAIQDEISRGIVSSLRLKLGQGRRLYETNVEAYDLYLRARTLTDRGITAFEQVVAKDPTFAPAYFGLASAHAYRSGVDRLDPIERADEMSHMRADAEKALQLDPLLLKVELGIVFKLFPGATFSDGALKAIEEAKRSIFQPDWKKVLDKEAIPRASTKLLAVEDVNPEHRLRFFLLIHRVGILRLGRIVAAPQPGERFR